MDIQEILAMTPSELEHYGVKGQKWGVRKAKAAGDRVATSLRNTSNQISHPVKYAKAATREIKGHGYLQTGNNHASRKRMVADVNNQITKSREKSKARILKLAGKAGNAFNTASKIAYGIESDMAHIRNELERNKRGY